MLDLNLNWFLCLSDSHDCVEDDSESTRKIDILKCLENGSSVKFL